MEKNRGCIVSLEFAKPSVRSIGLILLLALTTPYSATLAYDDQPSVALPNCTQHCGNLKIPYPFGVGVNCSHSPSFEILCNPVPTGSAVPFLGRFTFWSSLVLTNESFYTPDILETGDQVTDISFGPSATDNSVSITGSFGQLWDSGENLYASKRLDTEGTPYQLMGEWRNALLVGGCNGGAVLLRDKRKESLAGCATACVKSVADNEIESCYGLECCQSPILSSHDVVEMDFLNFVNQTVPDTVSAAVVDVSYVATRKMDRNLSEFGEAPTVLQWKILDLPTNSPSYANSLCVKGADGGYTCRCRRDYYQGNPYLPYGCRVIRVCRQCPEDCIFTGNHTFHCPPSPKLPPSSSSRVMLQKLVLGVGIPLAAVFTLIITFLLYQYLKKMKEIAEKRKNFKKNGGLLLHQQTRISDSSIERTKLFSSNELEKATDEFNHNRVLGRGGQGTVYKGMLVDGTIVAIKKSMKVSEKQLQQFINEVVILSQVNHRNVVKLFGCCLETDVPLLVYEYVPNGTLYQHLHNPYEDFRITWKMRLLIATETAEALAYLHSWSFAPIYHRDIKTSNILLDDRYKAKVADFGMSKTLSLGQSHVTTHVQGTIGYMDPEFLQSSQFTEKSDVYSFGIVLLELLTNKKAIFYAKPEEPKRLASEFLDVMKNSNLYAFVDAQVLQEAKQQEIKSVADLAKRCLNLNGKERPVMKEVAITLQIIASQSQNSASNNSSHQEFKNDEMNADQIRNSIGGVLSTSSSYGPR